MIRFPKAIGQLDCIKKGFGVVSPELPALVSLRDEALASWVSGLLLMHFVRTRADKVKLRSKVIELLERLTSLGLSPTVVLNKALVQAAEKSKLFKF
jgi:hypothetical protein